MIQWNLQQFSGEKTEKPTPQKLREARQKGQVAKSTELSAAILLGMGILGLYVLSGYMMETISMYFSQHFSLKILTNPDQMNVHVLFIDTILWVAKLLGPLLALILVIAVLSQYLQVGALFTPSALLPKWSRISPIEGFKRMFSLRSLIELIKSIIKVTAVGWIAYTTIRNDWSTLSNLSQVDVYPLMTTVGGMALAIFWKSALLLLGIALLDWFYQRFEHEKNLRMSKQEVKEEWKRSEGDPMIRNRIRERGRALAMQQMMQDVPKADVVITNPTHYAVAIQYDVENMQAPLVIAKGIDDVAQRIKEKARLHDVILVENRVLAQTLYKTVEIGDSIPEDLFQAIAEVLAYVYRLKNKL